MVVVQVWDLSGQFPLGFQKVEAEVLRKAEELAQERGAVVVEGLVRLALQDLDLAQVQGTEWEWVEAKEQVQVAEQESALPRGYRLDSELGLVRDWESVQVAEMELG